MNMSDQGNSEGESSPPRPQLSATASPLRKLQYDGSYFLYLGNIGERAGLDSETRVVPDAAEDGSIALLEDLEGAEDARSLMGEALRVNLPRSLFSYLDIDLTDYDPERDPIVIALDPLPDEEGFPSGIEIIPLGYKSGVLDDEGYLLPPDERDPMGDQGEPDSYPVVESDTGRQIYPVGIAPKVVQIACDHFSIDLDEFYETLEAISSIDDDSITSDLPFSPVAGSERVAHFSSPGTWDAIADRQDIPDGHMDAVQFVHSREAKHLMAEHGVNNHSDQLEKSEPIVLPD